jgi:hypothetical protein
MCTDSLAGFRPITIPIRRRAADSSYRGTTATSFGMPQRAESIDHLNGEIPDAADDFWDWRTLPYCRL